MTSKRKLVNTFCVGVHNCITIMVPRKQMCPLLLSAELLMQS